MYPQQVCMVSKWSIENYKRSWLHKLHTLRCKKLPKMTKNCLSPKCHNFVKNYFFVCKNSHAHFQCIHNKYAWFQNDPLKTVRGVDYTNSIPYNAKSCLKWLSSKSCNSVKINSSSTKKPTCTSSICPQQVCKVSKRSIKNCGRSWLHKLYTVKRDERTDGQTDRQTDGQTGANLNAPWLSSRGHKNGSW